MSEPDVEKNTTALDARTTAQASARTVAETDARVQLATERTLLAWVRTGLALMAFGFVVARFAIVLHTLGVTTDFAFTVTATVVGILMIVLGVCANAGASLHYRKYFQRINRVEGMPFSAWSLAVWVALSTSAIGFVLVIYLLLFDLSILSLPVEGN